jgi:hypothetical protein
MKRILISVFLILFSISAFTQNIWAPVGAKWYYNNYSGGPEFLTVIESTGDTIVNTKPCKILETYEINAAMDSIGSYHWDTLFCQSQFTYEDSGIVYLYDEAKDYFTVLYNFNANNGDTITVVDSTFAGYCPEAYESNKFQYVVDSTTNTVISGIPLRKQFVSPAQNSDWVITTVTPSGPTGNFPIIERIGATKYLFGVFVNQAMEGSIKDLRCYIDGDLSFHFDWSDSIPCDDLPPLSIYKIDNPKPSLNIYPNPTSGIVTIEVFAKTTVEILDSKGQIIETITCERKKTTIDLSKFPSGFYLVKLITDEGVVTNKLIKE